MRTSYVVVLGALLIAGGYAAYHFTRPTHEDAPPPAPVPVTAGEAKDQTLPVYLRGIGSVTALNAVEIRPQVGGVLLDVPVKEGDQVKKGDVLAVIDPRPYKAALDKAQAQLVQDQAQLQQRRRPTSSATRPWPAATSPPASRSTPRPRPSPGCRAWSPPTRPRSRRRRSTWLLRAEIPDRRPDRPAPGRPGQPDPGQQHRPGIISVVQDQPISVLFSLPETDLAADPRRP